MEEEVAASQINFAYLACARSAALLWLVASKQRLVVLYKLTTMPTNELGYYRLPDENFRRLRDKTLRQAKRNLHITGSEERSYINRNGDYTKRYDYVLTPSDLGVLVESVIRDTELAVAHALKQENEIAAGDRRAI